jgi:hypothetical protein
MWTALHIFSRYNRSYLIKYGCARSAAQFALLNSTVLHRLINALIYNILSQHAHLARRFNCQKVSDGMFKLASFAYPDCYPSCRHSRNCTKCYGGKVVATQWSDTLLSSIRIYQISSEQRIQCLTKSLLIQSWSFFKLVVNTVEANAFYFIGLGVKIQIPPADALTLLLVEDHTKPPASHSTRCLQLR